MRKMPNIHRLMALILAMSLPVLAHALTMIEIGTPQVLTWAQTGEVVTVPMGTAYVLELPAGDQIVLNEETQFKVTEENGEVDRVIILNGTLVIDGFPRGDPIEIQVGDNIITSAGADMIVSADGGGGISLAQMSGSGTVTLNGDPIPPDSGGTITPNGSYAQDDPIESGLDTVAQIILMDTVRNPNRPDGTGPPEGVDPQGQPPYDRLKDFPRTIVEENLNDLSPS